MSKKLNKHIVKELTAFTQSFSNAYSRDFDNNYEFTKLVVEKTIGKLSTDNLLILFHDHYVHPRLSVAEYPSVLIKYRWVSFRIVDNRLVRYNNQGSSKQQIAEFAATLTKVINNMNITNLREAIAMLDARE